MKCMGHTEGDRFVEQIRKNLYPSGIEKYKINNELEIMIPKSCEPSN